MTFILHFSDFLLFYSCDIFLTLAFKVKCLTLMLINASARLSIVPTATRV